MASVKEKDEDEPSPYTEIEINSEVQEVPFQVDRVNRFDHPVRMMIAGPPQSGKSTFIKNLVKYRKSIFTTEFSRVLYCIPVEMIHAHRVFCDVLKTFFPNLEVVGGLPKAHNVFNDGDFQKLVIIDDLMIEIFRSSEMTNLFSRLSSHGNTSVVFTTQNFFESQNNKTIVRMCNAQVIFNNNMDKVMIRNIGSMITTRQPDFLNNCFETLRFYFPKEKHPYILIDGTADQHMNGIMFRSHIFPNQLNEINPLCFFVNPQYNKKR